MRKMIIKTSAKILAWFSITLAGSMAICYSQGITDLTVFKDQTAALMFGAFIGVMAGNFHYVMPTEKSVKEWRNERV